MATAAEKLALAKKHLRKAEVAWDPPEWDDLSLWGFYCLEAAVESAAIHHGVRVTPDHSSRVRAAGLLHSRFGLPDVSHLLRDLNETRKSVAYGDVVAPVLEAKDVISAIQGYVEQVDRLVGQSHDPE